MKEFGLAEVKREGDTTISCPTRELSGRLFARADGVKCMVIRQLKNGLMRCVPTNNFDERLIFNTPIRSIKAALID